MMHVRPLSPALAEKARIELGESPEVLESRLRELKEWISGQPHLKARTDDQWLVAFLRGCKFRLEQAKTKIDLYYSLRSTAPDLYPLKYNHSKIMDIIDMSAILFLPKTKNPDDPRIILMKQGCYNPKEYSVFEIMAVSTLLHQICLMEDDVLTVAGVITVVDLTGTHLGHFKQASLKQIRNLVRAHQDAVPLRIKATHFVGTSYLFNSFINIIKRFFSEKLRNRLHFHMTPDTLYEHLPRELLPAEMGGTCGTLEQIKDHWKRKFVEYSGFFEEDLQYGTDETKRVADQKKRRRWQVSTDATIK